MGTALKRLETDLAVSETTLNGSGFGGHHPVNGWPREITVDTLFAGTIIVKIDRIFPFSDPAQINDVKTDLLQLKQIVCVRQPRVRAVLQKAVVRHTDTRQEVTCPEMGESLDAQQYKMVQAIDNLIVGQQFYGPAAIWGRVVAQENERIEYGRLSASVHNPPPRAPQEWPSDTLDFKIPDSPGVAVRIQTRGPTLDDWDRLWFDLMCQAVLVWLPTTGALQAPVGRFTMPSNPFFGEHLQVTYYPEEEAGQELPTRQIVFDALGLVQMAGARYGARELLFYIAHDEDLLSIGSLQFAVRPPSHLDEGVGTRRNITLPNNIAAAKNTSGDDNPSGGTSQA
ncbi:MAG: hypothetical protein Q9179_001984 [Wetmoreana sp. 5 TL-2023]